MKHIAKILAAVMILSLLLVGCSGKNSIESQLPGTWYPEKSEEAAFTLYDDGTCKIAYEYGTGTWSVVNDNQLKLTNYYGESEVANIVEISDGKLILGSDGNTRTFINKD